jgi:macrolide transport system ATP-binding/permease protein
MKRLRAWLIRLTGLFTHDQRDRELSAEIECNLQLHIDDNIRAGMTPKLARREAILKLGGVESTKQLCHERSTLPYVEDLARDIGFAMRQLRKNPAFAATAILMLALGICGSVAIFAFVDAALLKPLPYKDSARLMAVFESIPLDPRCNLSYFDYLDWKKMNTVFESLEAFEHTGFTLRTQTGPEMAYGGRVSAGFFRALGVRPLLGRDFHSAEDQPFAPRTAILSYSTWRKRYQGRRNIVGETVTLDDTPATIIGVLPPEFHFQPAAPAEFWTQLNARGYCEQRRSCHNLYGIARLKDGVSMQGALKELQLIAKQLEKQYPGSNRDQGAAVAPLTEVILGKIRPILLVLLGGASLLLLIACVNITSLLLVRSESRRRELAVRSALGASRAHLVRQFVTEGFVLVSAGSVLGVLLSVWATQLLQKLIPSDMMARMPYLEGLGFNLRTVLFAGGIALLASVLFAVTPAVHVSWSDMRLGLSEGSRGSAGNAWRRIGSKLVIVELATAVILLAGAVLLGQSLYRLLHVDIGIRPDHLAALAIAAPHDSYAKDEQTITLARQVMNRIAVLPGVKSVGISTRLPVLGNGNSTWFRILGRPYHGEHNEANEREVSPGYLPTLQARLLRGRFFTETDEAVKHRVAIINQTLARKYFSGENPVGLQIGDTELTPKSIMEIVGVVDDIKESTLDSDVWPTLYVPFAQSPDTYFSIVVRTSQSEDSLIPAMVHTVRQIDSGIVTRPGTSVRKMISDSEPVYLRRSSAWLVAGFASVALLLGIVGLYGVISYSISQRTREIGVRMALGAERSSVYRLVLKEAGQLTLIGIVVGMVCSVGTSSLMRGLLFGVSSWDLRALAAVAFVLSMAALLASYVPARRAASVNPVEALRAE